MTLLNKLIQRYTRQVYRDIFLELYYYAHRYQNNKKQKLALQLFIM
jgi:hypothetical protein